MAFPSKNDGVAHIRIGRSLRTWLAGASTDPDASTAGVLGCAYLFLISLADIFDSAR
jgi:hypothetical protein